jgi:hypothetical protein
VFRTAVARAAELLAPTVPFVAAWTVDDGFIGDGRLARVQAGDAP